MSTLAINLDMGRVQSSVQAAVRPAVEAALGEIDIAEVIKSELLAKRMDDPLSRLMRGYGDHSASPTLIERMIRDGIREMAKHYVQEHLRSQRGEIEEAFRKMMMGSADRLVRSFSGAVDEALKEDWGFELDVKVSHKSVEASDD